MIHCESILEDVLNGTVQLMAKRKNLATKTRLNLISQYLIHPGVEQIKLPFRRAQNNGNLCLENLQHQGILHYRHAEKFLGLELVRIPRLITGLIFFLPQLLRSLRLEDSNQKSQQNTQGEINKRKLMIKRCDAQKRIRVPPILRNPFTPYLIPC